VDQYEANFLVGGVKILGHSDFTECKYGGKFIQRPGSGNAIAGLPACAPGISYKS